MRYRRNYSKVSTNVLTNTPQLNQKYNIKSLHLLSHCDTAESTRNFQVAVRFSLPVICMLVCAQANSASYPSWNGKWAVAYELWGEGLMWLTGAVLCLLAANRRSNCSLRRAMDGRIVRCGIISSCQSAVTFETVKRFRFWVCLM